MDKSCNSDCRGRDFGRRGMHFGQRGLWSIDVLTNHCQPHKPARRRSPLSSGQFYSILHPTAGTATIYQMGDGTRVLRFTGFSTSNGPDVHVYIVAADDAKDVATVRKAGFIDLGVIKGNIGDQNYTLDGDLDLAKYRAVSIWCKRFSVNFGAAALRPTEASQIH